MELMEMLLSSSSYSTGSPAVAVLAVVVAVVLGYVVIGGFDSSSGANWVKSQRIRRKLEMQGIKGPSPCFLYGNAPQMHRIKLKAEAAAAAIQNYKITAPLAAEADDRHRIHTNVAHDYTSSVFPYLEHWRKQYGPVYTYSSGLIQHLYVNEPELVKEMSLSTSLGLGKPSYLTKRFQPMLGNGIIRANGNLWAHQRKIIAPEFFLDKVKGMVALMVESTEAMLRKWEESISASTSEDIRIDEDLRSLTADVIIKTCFGSSFSKGRQIISKLRILQKIISDLPHRQSILFGSTVVSSFPSRFLPNKKQREINGLDKEIESLIWETVLVEQRQTAETDHLSASASNKKNLLQLILEGASADNNNSNDSSDNYKKFVVDNCKNIYFAGHESTALTATWCMMLLALHPEWQSLMRTEVAQLCKNGIPDADSIPHLKTVGMVIQEAMRLYPPAAFVSREALEEVRIGNILVPKGTCIWTLIPALHRDPEMWGPDANEFKPERFRNGVAQACKIPQAYAPFGAGARLCVGKNFAMVQLKVILSLIVSRFTFTLSPAYTHSPTFRMLVEPEHGVHIRMQTI